MCGVAEKMSDLKDSTQHEPFDFEMRKDMFVRFPVRIVTALNTLAKTCTRAVSEHRRVLFVLTSMTLCFAGVVQAHAQSPPWKKHLVYEGLSNQTVIAGDFTKDGLPDIITCAGKKTRLFIAPDWRQIVIEDSHDLQLIHSEVWDIDHDGDLDFVGGQFSPGVVVWLEQPDKPMHESWPFHLITNRVNGVHGLIKGDVDQDGIMDVLATSSLTEKTSFTESMVWLRGPSVPRTRDSWELFPFANKDAPGLIHYIGFGDVNRDGRPDAATGAKGNPSPHGDYFAWWLAGKDPTLTWK